MSRPSASSTALKGLPAEAAAQLRSYRQELKAIVKSYKGREGFIYYRDCGAFARELHVLLKQPDPAREIALALETGLLVLEEAVKAFQYADDSNGDIGALAMQAVAVIEQLAHQLDKGDDAGRERFFRRLLTVSDSETFQGWSDFPLELLRICSSFADDEAYRTQLRGHLESRLAANGPDKPRTFKEEELLELLFALVEQYGSDDEAADLAKKHVKLPFFRQWLIDQSMKRGDFAGALKLAEAGERQDSKLPGLVIQWKKARYYAYKKLSLTDQQAALAEELLMDGEFGFYRELAEMHPGEEDRLYRHLIALLRQGREWETREVYQRLVLQHHDLEELLDYVQSHPQFIEEFGARLMPQFKDEVQQVYRQRILDEARGVSARSGYRRVCYSLKRMGKVCGKEAMMSAADELRQRYAQRPAFLDELSKLK